MATMSADSHLRLVSSSRIWQLIGIKKTRKIIYRSERRKALKRIWILFTTTSHPKNNLRDHVLTQVTASNTFSRTTGTTETTSSQSRK